MLKSIKTSFKDTIIYGLGNIAVKVVGVILIPIFTDRRYFPIDDFGVLGMLEATGLILTAALASGLPQSLTRWYWDDGHKANQKGIFFMSVASQVAISILFCALLIPLSGTISGIIFSKHDWSKVIILIIIASGIQSINNIINTLMRLQSKSVLYSITNLVKLVTVLSLTIYFIISRKMGLEGIYLAQVLGNGLVVLILIGYTVRNSVVFFDKTIFRSMNIYGFPLLLANISAAVLTVVDKYTLNSITILKSVALYTMATKISSVIKLVFADSIKLAIGPIMIKKMNAPDNKRFYSKVLLYTSYVMMFAIIGVSLFSYEVIKVISKSREFWGAVAVIPVLSLSVFFVNMRDVTVYGLHLTKKTRIIGIIVLFTTFISIALNILLITFWDIAGAAVATLISQFVYWLACYYFSQKAFFVPYEIRKIAVLFLTGTAISFSCMLINGMDLLPRLIIKAGCFISFPFILYLFNFYETVELQAIRGFINKWSKIKDLKSNLNSLKGITDEL
jgi:O-antigen/teichoic acid export membrane protein